VAESKNCPFEVNTTIELKNITTSDSKVIYQGTFQLRSVPVLSDVVVTFLNSVIVLSRSVNLCIVQLCHSLSNI
jgi:hypothetical protein